MKLIVEKVDGQIHVYREDEKHFNKAQHQRLVDKSIRIDPSSLDGECNLDTYPDNDFHIVFDLKDDK
jgi:hypothetical protein